MALLYLLQIGNENKHFRNEPIKNMNFFIQFKKIEWGELMKLENLTRNNILKLLLVSLISGSGLYANTNTTILDIQYENDESINNQVVLEADGAEFFNVGKIQSGENGIYSEKHVKSIENNGVIVSASENLGDSNKFYESGNGIYIKNDKVENIKNSGFISGKININTTQSTEGYTDNSINGNGIILSGKNIGNTYFIQNQNLPLYEGIAEKLENTGVIRGEANIYSEKKASVDGVANGIVAAMVRKSKSGDVASKITMEDIQNSGKIRGILKVEGQESVEAVNSGNGISNHNTVETYLNKLDNKGFISGKTIFNTNGVIGTTSSGNGVNISSVDSVFGGDAIAKKIENNGFISGSISTEIQNSKAQLYDSGNGISVSGRGDSNLEKLINKGVISGNIDIKKNTDDKIKLSGNGVSVSEFIGILNPDNPGTGIEGSGIINSGVIRGSESAVAVGSYNSSKILGVSNYGLLIGKKIFSKIFNPDTGETQIAVPVSNLNLGTHIKLKSDSSGEVDSIEFTNEMGGTYDGRDIINATKDTAGTDSFIQIDSDREYANKIVNGAGVDSGVLAVDSGKNLTLTNSIINGYKTAVSLGGGNNLVAKGTTFNGGGLAGENPTIEIKGDNVKVDITENSIINGKIIAKGNNGTIHLGNTTAINGDIISTGRGNTLNLGNMVANEELKIYHEIRDFDEINTNGKVTLYETSRMNATTDINIEHGTLLVRVNGAERDEKGRVTGHALYTHTGKIVLGEYGNVGDHLPDGEDHPDIQAGAKLFFKASGLKRGTVIAMNGTDITDLQDSQMGTYSIAHTARKFIPGKDDIWLWDSGASTFAMRSPGLTDVIIDTLNFDDIIDEPENPDGPPDNEIEDKEDLGDIWDSIVNGGEEDELAPTLDYEDGRNITEAKKELVSILDQIYANNPYAYIGEASRESLRLYHDNIFTTKMPKKDEWIVEGHGIYGYDKLGKVEQKNRFGTETQKNGYTTNIKTYGMLGTAEYGIAEDTSVGIAVGGSKQKVGMSKGSKIDGNSGYIGVYGKRNIDKFRLTGGIGYQYNEYDVDRILSNKYQSFKNSGKLSTDGLGIYLEGRYFITDKNGTSLEPKLRLSHTYISQEAVKEKQNRLAIDVDGKNYQNTEIEIGADLSKKKYLEGGVLEFRGGVSYIKTLGSNGEYLTGRIKNSTNFRIKGPQIAEDKARITVGVDYEKTNGIFYNLYTGVELANRDRIDTNIKVGIGYRF